MGMYDSIYIEVKCPYCNEVEEQECQTKALDNMMHRYKEGDYIGDEYKDLDWVRCIIGCYSDQCIDTSNLEHHAISSGMYFYIDLKLDRGKVTKEYRIINS